ncbi:YdbC family protein [Mobilibacterium timonense]|uniref:YdbC family protein n=1 Tax=Mobilibacterium timonense TaxID=1871012 RepID=UPI0009859C20|nr:PC4/YdbC family ssDNA-binding protein [Mobilibacterium timonense]
MKSEFKYEIKEYLGVLSTSRQGWNKEVNVISWNGRPEKIDIREWSPEHDKMSKGLSLTADEMDELVDIWVANRR